MALVMPAFRDGRLEARLAVEDHLARERVQFPVKEAERHTIPEAVRVRFGKLWRQRLVESEVVAEMPNGLQDRHAVERS